MCLSRESSLPRAEPFVNNFAHAYKRVSSFQTFARGIGQGLLQIQLPLSSPGIGTDTRYRYRYRWNPGCGWLNPLSYLWSPSSSLQDILSRYTNLRRYSLFGYLPQCHHSPGWVKRFTIVSSNWRWDETGIPGWTTGLKATLLTDSGCYGLCSSRSNREYLW